MTEHEHAEVSRKLALAIGWKPDDVQLVSVFYGKAPYCEVWPWGGVSGGKWRKFDYRDPAVCWAVAERFDCFPRMSCLGDEWMCCIDGTMSNWEKTAALAVARAVIASQEAK